MVSRPTWKMYVDIHVNDLEHQPRLRQRRPLVSLQGHTGVASCNCVSHCYILSSDISCAEIALHVACRGAPGRDSGFHALGP